MRDREPRRINRVAAVASAFFLAAGLRGADNQPTQPIQPPPLTSVCNSVEVKQYQITMTPGFFIRNRLPEGGISILDLRDFKPYAVRPMPAGERVIIHDRPAVEVDFETGNKVSIKIGCIFDLPMA